MAAAQRFSSGNKRDEAGNLLHRFAIKINLGPLDWYTQHQSAA
jgi:hypothetical protein